MTPTPRVNSVPARLSLLSTTAAVALVLAACTSTNSDDAVPTSDAPSPTLPSSTPDADASDPEGTEPTEPTDAVVAAADAFLADLSAEQRDRVLYDIDDPALREWFYFPSVNDRNGLAFGELTDEQLVGAFRVAEEILSENGYEQLRGVLDAEDVLGVRNAEADTVNSGRYFIAFFGTPSGSERFTVQINGHHFALNTTYHDGRVSPTPAFVGVDPVEIEVAGQRIRPMQIKTDAVSGLLRSLDEGDVHAARIGAIDDVRVGTGASTTYPEPEGALVTDLDAGAQERVIAVVRAWVGDTDDRVADALMREYEAEFDRTRVAWSGSTDPDTPGSYLRIDGPRVWIEFSNVGRFGNGDNHYHSVYRDRQGDYLD